MGGSFTGGKFNIPLSEVGDELQSGSLYLSGHRQIQFVYVNGKDVFFPVISSDPNINCGYNFHDKCWEISFSQVSYEILAPGEYKTPTPIKLARTAEEKIAVEINIFYFYDPYLNFPIYLSGEWNWDIKIPYYPDEQGFVEVILSPDRINYGFNLSWFNSSGKEIWMNLNQMKRNGVPCIKNGTEGIPAAWNVRSDWENLLPVTLTDPDAWVTPHVNPDDPNECCCIDNADSNAGTDSCPEADCNCPSCPECDSNVPIIDPETGLRFYEDGIWGDPEPNRHFMFQEVNGKWNLFFLKSDLPEDQWEEKMYLRGTFNSWKSTIELIDSAKFPGWIRTKDPIEIESGPHRCNWGCYSRNSASFLYANHSNFSRSMFHLEWEGAFSFGFVVPEEGEKLIPWD